MSKRNRKWSVKVLWEGHKKLENTLYFANRKNTAYEKELDLIKDLFKKAML